MKRWQLHQIPWVKNAVEIWHFGEIQDLQQIFRIVKMLVKMLYLHWVEGMLNFSHFPVPLHSQSNKLDAETSLPDWKAW